MEKKQFTPRTAEKGNPRRPKSIRKSFGRLLRYFSDYKKHIVLALFCTLLFVFGSVYGTYLMKPIFNSLTDMFQSGGKELGAFIQNLIVLAIMYAVSAIASYLSPRILLPISTNIIMRLRQDMFSHLQKLPLQYFDTHTHGEIMSRFTNDTDSLREMLGNALPVLMSNAIQIVAILVAMFLLSWELSLVVLLFFGIMLWIARSLSRKSAKLFRKRMATMARANGFMEEYIEGQREVRLFDHERRACVDFEPLAEELRKDSTGATAYSIVLMPIMGNLNYVLYTAVAATGVLMLLGQFGVAAQAAVSIGTIAAFLQYSRQFSQPISQISMQWNVILNALAGCERIFALLDEETEVDNGSVTLIKDAQGFHWQEKGGKERPLCGDVRFEHVTFSYNTGNPVLRDVSLYAKPGQKIAFVGSTGAGKTTITNLINRFYEIQEGEITYDGLDIRDIQKNALRSSLSMVLQDTHLFTGTVRENIRYGRLDATDAEVERAARLANAHYFIAHLPQGYDTILTADGSNLSQGQRQLLAIARAAVADPPVLILDEATSSVDTRTERLIEKGMDQLMQGRTVFVIAHRLSTVRNANAILVLEQGRVIERGSHDDLLAMQGKYYQLYNGMFELS